MLKFKNLQLKNNIIYILGFIYILMVLVLCFSNYFEFNKVGDALRHLNIPILFLIYYINSTKRDFLYLSTLFLAFLSTILFAKQPEVFVFYAILVFVVYRILSIIIVLRNTKKIRFFPIVIGTVPFLTTLIYIIFLTQTTLNENFYSAIASAFLVSFLAGISISNYVLEDNIKNTWLLISSLLFFALVFIYIIENYFVFNRIFQPMRNLSFLIGHFLFYKYIILDEQSNEN